MPSYDAANINQLLIAEAGRIGPDMHQRMLNTSPWIDLVDQGTWPDEMGESISVLVYERSLPTGSNTWANVTTSAGTSGGACAVPANTLDFAQTLRTYNLQQRALETPDICVNDLRYAFKRQAQLGNMMNVLAQNTRQIWIDRYRDEYIRIAQHKMICVAALSEDPSAFPETVPTSRLKQSVLDKIYQRLIRFGAGAEGALGRESGRPVFGLITDAETSESLIKDNDDIRQDFRRSKPNELLAPLGVERSYKGFYHIIDDFPPRYTFNAGASAGSKWVRVQPYAAVAAVGAASTRGTRYDSNPNYDTAPYMDSVVFVKMVYKSLIPAPISSVGKATFDPVVYKGDFQWKNILDRYLNPDGTIGYFRAIFSNGSEPIHPEFGFVIRHLTSPVTLDLD